MNPTCPTTSPFASQRICPLRMMRIASYPAIVFSAPSVDRNHRPAAIRFLMNRWSCSTMLFMYGDGRQRHCFPISPDCFNSEMAAAYAGWPSTLMTLGRTLPRAAQRKLEEVLGREKIPFEREHELNGFSTRIHCSLQVHP